VLNIRTITQARALPGSSGARFLVDGEELRLGQISWIVELEKHPESTMDRRRHSTH